MKKKLLYFLGAILITVGIFLIANFAEVYSCAPGLMVNGLCVGIASDTYEGYFLDSYEVCDSEEWDCQYIYKSPYTGEPLILPDTVSENLTLLSYPHLLSPYLENLVYVDITEDGSEVHVYDLRTQQDHVIQEFSSGNRGVSGFEWDGDERFSFVSIEMVPFGEFPSQDNLITRYTYQWTGKLWTLDGEEIVTGNVDCNPIYCELE